jgi:hypothetical protein
VVGRGLILLVGECGGWRVRGMQQRGWGRMFVVRRITPYPGEPWGFDNGAFVAWRLGQPWPEQDWLRRLEAAVKIDPAPQLAIVPDVVGSTESLPVSLRWIRQLRGGPAGGWPWYLALQDGMTPAGVERVMHLFDGLFLGGTDRFKREAAVWAALARSRGLAFHYGRASTFERLEHALEIGATSADTTNFMWTTKKWARLLDWWDDSRLHQGQFFRKAGIR